MGLDLATINGPLKLMELEGNVVATVSLTLSASAVVFTLLEDVTRASVVLVAGGFSEMWDQSFTLEKKSSNFFLKTSLVHLGGSPDTIGKVS